MFHDYVHMNKNYFVGIYWGPREESRQSSADRLSGFLCALASHNTVLSKWYKQGKSRKEASQVVLPNDSEGLAPLLKTNRRDIGREVIPELGFSFSAWSGPDASISASLMVTCGSYSRFTGNAVVIRFEPNPELDIGMLESILHAAVAEFEPEHGVVSWSGAMSANDTLPIWEAPSLLRYQKGVGFSTR